MRSLLTRHLEWACEPEDAFAALYRFSPEAFWLDGDAGGTDSRFSFMGDAAGALARTIRYDVGKRRLLVRSTGGEEQELNESIFDYLQRELSRRPLLPASELPFDFACGFAGFIGYEVGTEAVGEPLHRSFSPDAAFVFADRVVAFDARERSIWLVELVELGSEPGGWLDETEARLRALEPLAKPLADHLPPHSEPLPLPPFSRDLEREAYREAIEHCWRMIEQGESYEICLTTQLRTRLGQVGSAAVDPFELYRVLRRLNPAPYSAYLRFGDLAVLSSSPERFLKLDRSRQLESKPIKGTAPRSPDAREDARLAAELAADPKNRAENMMIADLMRNDLGRVCEIGSIDVPALAALECYPWAHQLVTTVTGELRADQNIVDAVRAAFPPGSMTGAPKIRTMEIIEELEPEPRGVYSGCLGYFSLDGCADLSVVIRTIVVRGAGTESAELSIGTGGAITVLSDPDDELAELDVKAGPLLRAIGLYSSAHQPGSTSASAWLGPGAPMASSSRPSGPASKLRVV